MRNIHKAIFAGTILIGAVPLAFSECTSHVLNATVKWSAGVALSKSARIVAETGPDYGAADANAHPSCIQSASFAGASAPVKISAWGVSATAGPGAVVWTGLRARAVRR